MKLRCKAGDMAIVTNGRPPSNNGKVLTCLRCSYQSEFNEHLWEVNVMLNYGFGLGPYIWDSELTPLNHPLEEDLEVYHQEPVEEWWN